jgi:putative hemolysin
MFFAVVLFLAGLMLSAFFSGTETGLYRVSRTRLVLDALAGSRSSKALVWLLNQPAIFVATALVGNNVANYLTSFAIVSISGILVSAESPAELVGPMLMTPVVFVFGELLPKSFFFHAPYRLVRSTRYFLLTFAILFAPVSIILGALGVLLRNLTGKTPFPVRLTMAKRELEKVLQDGHEAGILAAGQREFARRLLEVGNRRAISFGVAISRIATVELPIDLDRARNEARKCNHSIVLVSQQRRIVGYLRYSDLLRDENAVRWQAVGEAYADDRHLRVLLNLYDVGSEVALIKDESGAVKGIVTRRQLIEPLMK